jgi:D-alanyl-D-alanine carboxypeptidase (penicillin-binding protein 5/6)
VKLIAIIMILLASGLGLPIKSSWLKPAVHTLAPPSQAVSSISPALLPPTQTGQQPLTLSGVAYAVDAETMAPLYAAGQNQQLPIASLTKMMTAIVASHDLRPDQTVKVGQLPVYDPEDQISGFKAGEQFKVKDLLQATLIESADDAADSLALADAGSLPKFIAKMNRFAAAYGLRHTHFASASGLNDQGNYSSAHDLAILAKILLSNSNLQAIAATSHTTIAEASGRQFNLVTTNDLLATGLFSGIKTGYTQAAGQCFVGLTNIGGHPVITVVLHSSDRFADTRALHDWIERNWQWPSPVTPQTP